MRGRVARAIGGIAAVGAVVVLSAPVAVAGGEELATRLARAVKDKNEARAERKALAKEHGEVLAALDQDIETLEAEVDRLEARVARMKTATEPAAEVRGQADDADAELLRWIETQRAHALPLARRLVDRIRRGIPYQRDERLSEASRIVDKLSGGDDAENLEGLVGLRRFLTNELRLGESVELYNEPVTLDEEVRVNAYVIRVGRVLLAFASEEDGKVGIATPEGWNLSLDDEQRTSLVRATDILRRRDAPALGALPIWFERSVDEVGR